jgi:hypothetical protein
MFGQLWPPVPPEPDEPRGAGISAEPDPVDGEDDDGGVYPGG